MMLVPVVFLLVILGIIAWFIGPGLMKAARKWDPTAWLAVEACLLAGLAVPTSLLVETKQLSLPEPAQSAIGVLYLFPLLAFLAAAISIYLFAGGSEGSLPGVADALSGRRKTIAAGLLLGMLAFAKALYNLYWLVVWDSTYDALDFIWMILPVTVGAAAGILLFRGFTQRRRWVGVGYAVLVLALITGTYLAAGGVDTQALTLQRAGQISRALASYHARSGTYPGNLWQLVPGDLLAVPKPVVINGQDWCYQACASGYRFGVVDREGWYSPILFGRLIDAQGSPPDGAPLCSQEISRIQLRNPTYYGLNSKLVR